MDFGSLAPLVNGGVWNHYWSNIDYANKLCDKGSSVTFQCRDHKLSDELPPLTCTDSKTGTTEFPPHDICDPTSEDIPRH